MNRKPDLEKMADELLATRDCGYTDRIDGSVTDFFSLQMKHVAIPESGDVEGIAIPIRTATGGILRAPSHVPYDEQNEWEGAGSPAVNSRPLDEDGYVMDNSLLAPSAEEQMEIAEEQSADSPY